jgi:hypothetical protein
MSYFAQIDENNIVIQVITIEQDMINTGNFGDPERFIQTSYNTRGGVHYGQDGNPDGGIALRKNYAGIGYTYDKVRDAFIPPKRFPSWVLNEKTCYWESPIPKPNDSKLQAGQYYAWNEKILNWEIHPKVIIPD